MAKLENKTKENPKLEQNKLSDGRISLYLEYYLGREEKPVLDENGNQVYYDSGKMQGKPKFAVKHNRRKENLSLYLIDKPRTPAERQQNKETLELATKIRAEREQEFKESMGNVYSSSVCLACIDEAPEVYKDPSEIITGIQDTVKILEIIKPILSIKAGTGDGED